MSQDEPMRRLGSVKKSFIGDEEAVQDRGDQAQAGDQAVLLVSLVVATGVDDGEGEEGDGGEVDEDAGEVEGGGRVEDGRAGVAEVPAVGGARRGEVGGVDDVDVHLVMRGWTDLCLTSV